MSPPRVRLGSYGRRVLTDPRSRRFTPVMSSTCRSAASASTRRSERSDVAMWSVSSASSTSAASMTSAVPVPARSAPELLVHRADVDAV